MSRQIIKTGTVPNDRYGDSLFAAFTKVNENFAELYTITGGSTPDLKELIQDAIAEMISNGTLLGISTVYNDPNNSLSIHVTDAAVIGGFANTLFDSRDLSFNGGTATTETFTDMLINGGAA